MKSFFVLACMLLLSSAAAFAGPKNQTVTIPDAVQVGSTLVPAGDYKLTFTGNGPEVQVTLARQKGTPITFLAKTVAGKYDPGVDTMTAGGVLVLESIQLSTVSLVLESATHPAQ
jgi:hypothetical protein